MLEVVGEGGRRSRASCLMSDVSWLLKAFGSNKV